MLVLSSWWAFSASCSIQVSQSQYFHLAFSMEVSLWNLVSSLMLLSWGTSRGTSRAPARTTWAGLGRLANHPGRRQRRPSDMLHSSIELSCRMRVVWAFCACWEWRSTIFVLFGLLVCLGLSRRGYRCSRAVFQLRSCKGGHLVRRSGGAASRTTVCCCELDSFYFKLKINHNLFGVCGVNNLMSG